MLESVAYEYAIYLRHTRSRYDSDSVRSVRAVGGGARSALWNQLKADVLGLTWEPVRRQEGGALGSALIAGHAVGLIGDLGQAAEAFNPVSDVSFAPDASRHAAYRPHVDAYERLLEVGRSLFVYERNAESGAET